MTYSLVKFPEVDKADEHGLLATGGDLSLETLLSAYSQGVFPWPISEEYPLAWFAPDPRGIVKLDTFSPQRSLKKMLRKSNFHLKINTCFERVIRQCAISKNRNEQEGTWITEEIIQGYINLHEAGFAYSIETFHHNFLVGGVYGVHLGGFVSGESMFYLESNASKVALSYLLMLLKKNNIPFLDTQMITPIVDYMGGAPVSRQEFMQLLSNALKIEHSKDLFRKEVIPSSSLVNF